MLRNILMLVAVLGLIPAAGYAKPQYLQLFKKTYPEAAKLAATNCRICHEPDYKRNPYGMDLEKYKLNFKMIENFDSDGDSFINIEEIGANTQPGDKTLYPPSH